MSSRRGMGRMSRYSEFQQGMRRGTSTASVFKSVEQYAHNPRLRRHMDPSSDGHHSDRSDGDRSPSGGASPLLRSMSQRPGHEVLADLGYDSPRSGYSSASSVSPHKNGPYYRRKFHPKLKVLRSASSSPSLRTGRKSPLALGQGHGHGRGSGRGSGSGSGLRQPGGSKPAVPSKLGRQDSGISNSLNLHGGDSRISNARLAAMLAEWLVNMGDGSRGCVAVVLCPQRHGQRRCSRHVCDGVCACVIDGICMYSLACSYSSVALYLEVKLAEMESMIGHQQRPNRLRTSVRRAVSVELDETGTT